MDYSSAIYFMVHVPYKPFTSYIQLIEIIII